jgi:hypothetical protein
MTNIGHQHFSENFHELRFILHGNIEKYDSDKTLYITSQDNSVWEKVAREINESWQIIPPVLADTISKDWCKKLKIKQWNPEAAINVIIEKPNIEDFYLQILELIPEVNRESREKIKKQRWLPLQSAKDVISPENVVNLAIKELSDELENELERIFAEENSKYVILSQLNIESQYLDILKDIRSNWYENNVLQFLLSETSQPYRYCNLIIKTLKILQNRKQTISNENIELLRDKQWLVDSRNRPISLNKIINYPNLCNEFTNILTQLKSSEYITPKMLGDDIDINFCLKNNQINDLFCIDKDAIEAIGNALKKIPSYYIGDFDVDSLPLDEFIQVLKDFTELPVLALIKKISKDLRELILPNVLKAINNHEKLAKILIWISKQNQTPCKETILVYNKYLELACRDSQSFAQKILPNIQLLNQNNQWKSPSELCDGNRNTGIDKEDVLKTEQQRILSKYLDNITSSTNKEKNSVKTKRTKKTQENISEHLDKYFRPWLSYISSEIIGGFLCLLAGNNKEIQELSKSYLKKRDFDGLRNRFLWSDELKTKEFIINIKSCNTNTKNKQSVDNLFGESFSTSISYKDIPKHLFFGKKLDKNTQEITLLEFPLKEDFSNKLSNILKESAKLLIEKFYRTKLIEGFDEIWRDLATSKQLDILSVRNFILKNGYFLLKSLVNPNTEIGKYLSEWCDADAEIENLNIRRNQSDIKVRDCLDKAKDKLKNSKEAIKNIIHKNDKVCNEVLTAVRQKIGQGQYGYNCTNLPFELFQNADDSVAELQHMLGGISEKRLQYILSWDNQCLTVMHWGRPINLFIHPDARDKNFEHKGFDQDLIKMLCFNISDKSVNATGKFGLGFKTVHLISQKPIVISDELCFYIHGGLLPFALENLELEKQLRDKLQSQQASSDVKDGTLINLNIDTDIVTDINEVIRDFQDKVGLLLVFSKFIKTCKLIENSSLQQCLTWNPIEVLGIPGIEFGEVKILDNSKNNWVAHNLLCFRIENAEDATIAISLPGNFADKTSPLSEFPTFWVTTPTKETLGLRFIVNAMFDVTTGRTSLDRNSQRNIELASKIGQGLGEKLDQLFNGNWEALREQLKIKEADKYTFWEFLWNVLVVDWLKIKNNSEDTTQKLIEKAFGGEYCSMGYLIAIQPALPNGLYGDKYRQLVRLEQIRYVVKGILAEKQYFEKIANWKSFKQNCQPSNIVSNTVWQDVKKLLNHSIPDNVEELQFAEVLNWELGDKRVPPEAADRLAQVITREFFQSLKSTKSHHEEYKLIQAKLKDVRFLNQDNKYVVASKLLVKNNSEEESLLTAFAPDSRLLHSDYYIDSLIEFFLTCREQREKIELDEMVEWATSANTEEKKQAVRKYLDEGERKDKFITDLQDSSNGTWIEKDRFIKELFNINFQKEKVKKEIEGKIPYNEVNTSFKNENQNQIAPEIISETPIYNTEEILNEIYTWWNNNHAQEIEKYNQRLYPIKIDEFKQQLVNRDRSAWLMLFFLGATHTMGRTKHEQHRNFIKFCCDEGWWDTFSKANPGNFHGEWMSVLDDYMESQSDNTQWYYWMEKYPSIYRIARYLDGYITSFLSVEKIQEDFNLSSIVAPRTNHRFQGGGADAPPLKLGIGANFIVRELMRLKVINPTSVNHIFPYCFVPRANVRRLLIKLGCQDLRKADDNYSSYSRTIYKFLQDEFKRLNLSGEPIFNNCFDIPFEIYAEQSYRANRLNLAKIQIRDDISWYENISEQEHSHYEYFSQDYDNKNGDFVTLSDGRVIPKSYMQ